MHGRCRRSERRVFIISSREPSDMLHGHTPSVHSPGFARPHTKTRKRVSSACVDTGRA